MSPTRLSPTPTSPGSRLITWLGGRKALALWLSLVVVLVVILVPVQVDVVRVQAGLEYLQWAITVFVAGNVAEWGFASLLAGRTPPAGGGPGPGEGPEELRK